MPYPPHSKFVMGGTLVETYSYDEIWQCGVSLVGGGDGTLAQPVLQPNAYLGEIQAALGTWFAAGTSGMTPNAKLGFLKCNAIGADGKYSDNAEEGLYDYPTPVTGGGASASMPTFCSVVYGWTTTNVRPPAAYGRIYPPNSYSVTAARIQPTDQNAAVAAAKALLTILKNASSSQHGAVPIVASNVGAAHAPIVGVRVANVIDVQRRRKNATRPTYVSTTFP